MKLTKFEHACLVLEESGDTLVIDPGAFTRSLSDVTGVVAIVITHEHPDHWTAEQLTTLRANNPEAQILGPAGVVAAASDFEVTSVSAGDEVEVGAFSLRFFGGEHAVIHRSIPLVDNVGVLVNDELYFAGDSFAIPEGVDVATLAAPAGAPWMKVAEVIDYVEAVAPRRSFSVHEMVLSDIGKGMSDQRIAAATESGGGTFLALKPGDSVEL